MVATTDEEPRQSPTTDGGASRYEREVRVLRDWSVPSTLFAGIAITLLIYVFEQPLTPSLWVAAIAALISIAAFTANLLLIFGALGEVEMDYYESEVSTDWFHVAYAFSGIGILAFLVSVVALCAQKSTILGIASFAFVGTSLGVLVAILAKHSRSFRD